MKRVIVTGPYRTGTTLVYNIVRCLIKAETGEWPYICGNLEEYDSANPNEWHVIKTHKRGTWMATESIVICTGRDGVDTLASMKRFDSYHPNISVGDEEQFLRLHLDAIKWRRHADLIVNFGCSTTRKIGHISRVLGIGRHTEEAYRLVNEIKPPEEGHDPVTLLFSHHITSR